MIIKVKVKPNASKTEILSEGAEFEIAVAAPAENNRANIELIKFLSKKFGKNVKIMRGLTSKKKIIAVY